MEDKIPVLDCISSSIPREICINIFQQIYKKLYLRHQVGSCNFYFSKRGIYTLRTIFRKFLS